MSIWGRDEFFSARTTVELVELPTGDQVYVRVLSNQMQDAFEDMVSLARLQAEADGKPPEQGVIQHYRERMLILFACDEAGDPLFTEEDIPRLQRLDHTLTDPIIQRGNALNRLTRASLDADLATLQKKEPIALNGACGLESPASLEGAVSANGSAPLIEMNSSNGGSNIS
jgi:hypothetical protein